MKTTMTTEIFISKLTDLNKFYNDSIKQLAKKSSVSFAEMKEIVDYAPYGPVPKSEKFMIPIVKFIEEYQILMINIYKEVAIVGFELLEVGLLLEYVADQNSNQLKNLHSKSVKDIVTFTKLMIAMHDGSPPLSKDQKTFFYEFNHFIRFNH